MEEKKEKKLMYVCDLSLPPKEIQICSPIEEELKSTLNWYQIPFPNFSQCSTECIKRIFAGEYDKALRRQLQESKEKEQESLRRLDEEEAKIIAREANIRADIEREIKRRLDEEIKELEASVRLETLRKKSITETKHKLEEEKQRRELEPIIRTMPQFKLHTLSTSNPHPSDEFKFLISIQPENIGKLVTRLVQRIGRLPSNWYIHFLQYYGKIVGYAQSLVKLEGLENEEIQLRIVIFENYKSQNFCEPLMTRTLLFLHDKFPNRSVIINNESVNLDCTCVIKSATDAGYVIHAPFGNIKTISAIDICSDLERAKSIFTWILEPIKGGAI